MSFVFNISWYIDGIDIHITLLDNIIDKDKEFDYRKYITNIRLSILLGIIHHACLG